MKLSATFVTATAISVLLGMFPSPELHAARRRTVRQPAGPRPPVLSVYGDALVNDQYRSVPIGLPANSFTFETWMWLERFDPGRESFIALLDAGSYWNLAVTPSGMITSGAMSTPLPPKRRWSHVAFRSGASGVAILVDGVVVKSGAPSSVAVPEAPVVVGEFLTASFRQMRFWKVALTDAEIRRYMYETPQAGDPRIAAWWPMDDSARTGISTYFVEDFGPNHIHLGYPPTRAQWVRQEVLEAGPFFEAVEVAPTESPNPPLLIDFDHDGDLDLYTLQRMYTGFVPPFPYYAGEPPLPDRAFRNDGTGGFTEVSGSVLTGPRIQGYLCHGVFAGDFTGDGLSDVFVTDAGPEFEGTVFAPNSIRVGTAQGTLANESAARIVSKNTYDHRSAVGDIDGDGDLDVVSAGVYTDTPRTGVPWGGPSEGGPVLVFINDGSGRFTLDANRIPKFPGGGVASVALLDADLDADLDLFMGVGEYIDRNKLGLNDGSGRFTLAPDARMPPHRSFPGTDCLTLPYPCRQAIYAPPAADYDNDGIPDLIVISLDAYYPLDGSAPLPASQWRRWKHTLQLFLGNGDGSFRDGSSRIKTIWDVPGVLGSKEVGWYTGWIPYADRFDQNGDGWTDLIVASNGYTPAVVLINRGSAAFEEAGDLIPHARPLSLFSVGDIDRDGDDDVAADGWMLKNLRPYSPNAFPRTNLRVRMSVTSGITQTVNVDNTGAAEALQVVATVLVPHGYEWRMTDGQGSTCTLDRHVVTCTRPRLEAGASWRIVVTSQRQTGQAAATHAVASATADILDPDRTDNVARVSLAGVTP